MTMVLVTVYTTEYKTYIHVFWNPNSSCSPTCDLVIIQLSSFVIPQVSRQSNRLSSWIWFHRLVIAQGYMAEKIVSNGEGDQGSVSISRRDPAWAWPATLYVVYCLLSIRFNRVEH